METKITRWCQKVAYTKKIAMKSSKDQKTQVGSRQMKENESYL